MRRTFFASIAALIVISAAWSVWSVSETPLTPREKALRLVEDCQWEAAVDACDALLRDAPNDGEVVLWRGRSLMALGRHREACDEFARAVELRPDDPQPRYLRAMTHERLGNQDLADADFRTAWEIDPKHDKLLAARHAEQVAVDVRHIAGAAVRRAEQRTVRRAEAQANRDADRAAAVRDDEAAAPMGEESANAPAASPSPLAERPVLADLWNKSSAATDDLTGSDGGAKPSWTATSSDMTQEIPQIKPYEMPAVASPYGAAHNTNDVSRQRAPPADHAEPRPESTDSPAEPGVTAAATAWEKFQSRQAEGGGQNGRSLAAGDPLSRSVGQGPARIDVGVASQRQPAFALPDSAMPRSSQRTGEYAVETPLLYNPTARPTTTPTAVSGYSALHGSTASSIWLPWHRPHRGGKQENLLSTAIVPLPEPSADMNAALAAARPGSLTTALYEFPTPPVATQGPPLAAHTAPLPNWIAPPTFAAPK